MSEDVEMPTNFHEVEIAKLVANVVEHVSQIDVDVQVKMAGLRAAADVIQQAVVAQGLAIVLMNSLSPKR